MALEEIKSVEQWQKVKGGNGLVVVHFWAEWCEPCKQMDKVAIELASKYPTAKFFKVEAEGLSDISEEQNIESVPTFIIFKNGSKVATIEGANAPLLTTKVEEHARDLPTSAQEGSASSSNDLTTRLQQLVTSAPAMLFMKGTPEKPQCGFSSKIVAILQKDGIQFNSFNILADNAVREGLKKFSNWPTFPQLYFDGKLVGGLDIVKELSEEGELRSMAPQAALQNK